MLLISINLLAIDFRENNWGSSVEEVLKKESLPSVEFRQNIKTKVFKSHQGNYSYNYSVEEYSFNDTLGNLGEYKVTYSFLKNRLYKGVYTREIKEDDKSFERMKQFLIWKYGNDYKTYGLDDNFEWTNGRTKVVLNLFLGRNYTVEYYADSEYMKNLISETENGSEFIRDTNSEFREYNKIKEKI